MKTRCKFYVTGVEIAHSENSYAEEHTVTVAFNAAYSPTPNTENNSFWQASPNGRMKLTGPVSKMGQFKTGSYWYIDLQLVSGLKSFALGAAEHTLVGELADKRKAALAEDDAWLLNGLATPWGGSQLQVRLDTPSNRPWTSVRGEFEVSIDNRAAWACFQSLSDIYRMSMTETTKTGE